MLVGMNDVAENYLVARQEPARELAVVCFDIDDRS